MLRLFQGCSYSPWTQEQRFLLILNPRTKIPPVPSDWSISEMLTVLNATPIHLHQTHDLLWRRRLKPLITSHFIMPKLLSIYSWVSLFILLSTLAWKIPWTEEPGGLQSMASRRVGHDWATSLSLFTFMHWRRKWQPTPVFLPGESQGWGSLVGCCPWGRTESDTTEVT